MFGALDEAFRKKREQTILSHLLGTILSQIVREAVEVLGGHSSERDRGVCVGVSLELFRKNIGLYLEKRSIGFERLASRLAGLISLVASLLVRIVVVWLSLC